MNLMRAQNINPAANSEKPTLIHDYYPLARRKFQPLFEDTPPVCQHNQLVHLQKHSSHYVSFIIMCHNTLL